MILTSMEESAVLKAYNAYWECYVTGDVTGLASLLDEDYTQIGSVEGEVFNNKNDAVAFVQSTIDQIAGKVDMRNRKIALEPLETSVLVTEQTDLYILIDGEWNFYAKFRASSLMQKKGSEWKFVHQHSSMPDIRAEEGENIAGEKIAKENIELRDAVKRRTVELQQKNEELAMEAALERVRSVAMGMRKPEDLPDICEILYTELYQMGFSELRNAMINIYDDDQGSFVNYDYSDEIGKSINHLTYNIHPVIEKQVREIRSAPDAFSETVFSGKDLEEWKAFRKGIGEKDDPRIDNLEALHYYFYSIGTGSIGISTFSAIAEEKLQQLKRFRNVFDFAYRRYTDVAQAEAQARESQIQLALERVRARTMAMQHSSELKDAASLLFQQVKELGIDAWTCGYNIWNEDRKTVTSWLSRGVIQPPFKISLTENPTLNHFYEAAQRGDSLFVEEVSGETLTELYGFLGKQLEAAGVSEAIRQPGYTPPAFQVNHAAFFSYGHLLFVTYKPYPEAHDIFKRFAKVFEQTYTRFLDLEKAEAQAREAQIEAALERVRSRSMAMHRSEELLQVITVVSEQLQHLNFIFNTVSFAINNQVHDYKFWFAIIGNPTPIYIQVPYLKNPMFDRVKEVLSQGKGFYSDTLTPEESRQWHEHVFANADFSFLTEKTKAYILRSGYARSVAITPGISLIISNYAGKPYTDAENDIIKRFANVFEQSYTRFLDLQKAETQAREAQIEASLERVRSKTMAMHDSKDVGETVATMFDEFVKLGIVTNRCGILIFSDPVFTEVWTAKVNPVGGVSLIIGHLDTNMHPMLTGVYQAWQKTEKTFSYELAGGDIKDYYSAINNSRDYPTRFDLNALPDREIHSDFFFAEGAVFAFTPAPIPDDSSLILKRFAAVFGQTYRRYLDLQKAEAQAREATIEAALERVRYQAMAMQNSDDVGIATATMFTELDKLGIENIRCGIAIVSPDQTMEVWSATNTKGGKTIRNAGRFNMNDHPLWQGLFKQWINKEDYYHYYLQGEEKQDYYRILSKTPGYHLSNTINDWPDQHFQGYHFGEGGIWSFSSHPHTEEENKVFQRFTAVFSLTFRRYMDLKKAEAQARESEANAREAVRRASLDRVRAEIASMRTISDLDRITPLIWSELTILGVPFIRCGVFIMDEGPGLIHTFLSTPDGKALASFHLPFDVSDDISRVVTHWKEKTRYQQHWDEEAFLGWTKTLMDLHAIPSTEAYTTEHLPKNLYLNFLPFLQGMLYVGNEAPLQENDLQVVQDLADAFSTAYARYEDFNKLEEAKKQVDQTLNDLKQTQAQLVQAEKMASLGELTAGIAHEIQNPLNFVNNFSEINTELSDEILDAVNRGDLDEIKILAAGIKENQERISEHGKRADGIVKGMLQHSRSSSGVKEPADINKLADEYFRLAYHGLRAKNQSFNSSLITDFDPGIGMIPVTPQEIGRVLLNLYNNAFYAVAEKMKGQPHQYVPEVCVSTKMNGTKVEISVKDNGMGIPEKVKDKIFQPFFTTKPTGQGTGLGLSLSYDIIKAHGGELSVESKEGEGSVFVVVLPAV